MVYGSITPTKIGMKKRGTSFCLFSDLRYWKTFTQEYTMNAHADMLIAVWRNKHTKGHLPQSCFGCKKVSSFQVTKTSANKRLFIMSAKPIARIALQR